MLAAQSCGAKLNALCHGEGFFKQFFTELKLATTGTDTPEQAIVGYRGRHLNTWTKPGTWVKELWDA